MPEMQRKDSAELEADRAGSKRSGGFVSSHENLRLPVFHHLPAMPEIAADKIQDNDHGG